MVTSASTRLVVRLERDPAGVLQLAEWRPDSAVSRWTSRPLAVDALPTADRPDAAGNPDAPDGPALAAVGAPDGSVLLAGTSAGDGAAGESLAAWRIRDPLADPPVLERLDTAPVPGRRLPAARLAPSACLHADRLHVFGGEGDDGRLLGDLWSIALAGDGAGRWIAHVVRGGAPRAGGRLLSTPDGLVLLGGATSPGTLDVTVLRTDPARARPVWARLPDLPLPAGRPGTVWARRDDTPAGAALEVLAWADRTAPVPLRLLAGGRGWVAGPAEPDAPNPPAEGDAVHVDADLAVLGPPPLPPSELVFRLGGTGRLAALPAVDLPTGGGVVIFDVRDDASTARWFPPGEAARPSLRLGAGRAAPTDRRSVPAARLGAPGRLGWTPLRLRQASLARWDQPLAPAFDLDGRIGVDPRLGRVLLPAALAAGRATVSYRVARAEAIGAGFGGPPPKAWAAPGEELPAPPAIEPTAWVSPRTAGVTGTDGVSVVADLAAALALADGGPAAIGVLGSPRLPAQVLAADQGQTVSVAPVDTGGLPHLLAAGGVSLSLHERPHPSAADTDDPDAGPSWFLTGLSTEGAVELVVAGGDVDLRWCTLAGPGELSFAVAGAGHAPPLLRYTLPDTPVRVRLLGCRLGRVELPPWVRLTAAGCTFDAGDRQATAVAAAGADVRLRHCTVHGRLLAGRLAASSCVLTGAVVCDRPDRSWLRHSVAAPGGRAPQAFRGVVARTSLASVDPGHPLHLALAENNAAAVLAAGELGRTPGAHAGLAARRRELVERAADFLPLALVAHHVDATAADLERMR